MGHPVLGRYKYGDLALQIGGVSDDRVIYGCVSCATLTSDCIANYRPVLVREGALHEKGNCKIKKIKIWSWASKQARHQHELDDWPPVAL
jgi:hypothetical protein